MGCPANIWRCSCFCSCPFTRGSRQCRVPCSVLSVKLAGASLQSPVSRGITPDDEPLVLLSPGSRAVDVDHLFFLPAASAHHIFPPPREPKIPCCSPAGSSLCCRMKNFSSAWTVKDTRLWQVFWGWPGKRTRSFISIMFNFHHHHHSSASAAR